ncbi:hypothetical protein [Ottowia sp.]|uniref:hypothetical protein n=1 Tax=Ottowia sp. TaxID=1898956 RepID=UPI0025FD6808|nr:hypothetical protein [Ottowia sp.]MBK6616507.1 hypothetical protein [Ottowia sp.]
MNGRVVSVLMGFDRPLQGFFLVIEDDAPPPAVRAGQEEDEDEYVYSNLNDEALERWMGLPPTMDHFVAKLSELGIAVPQLMIDEVLKDKEGNVGNRHVSYDMDGRMIEAGERLRRVA